MADPAPYFRIELDLKRLGALLREAREDMHLSTRELSMQAGMSATQITRMEAGEDFAITKLVKLAVPLGLQPSYLIDRALSALTPDGPAGEPQAAHGYGELSPWLDDLHASEDNVTTTDMRGVVDFAGMSACLLLLSTNPKVILDLLLPPLPSMRQTLIQFIDAYGPQTDAIERAAVLRAIALRPVQKLKALGIISFGVVFEYLALSREHNQNTHSPLTLKDEKGIEKGVPEDADIWKRLVDRMSKATNRRGDRARLARDLNVTRQAVSNWLSGASAPSAVITLRLLEWVTAEEAKQNR